MNNSLLSTLHTYFKQLATEHVQLSTFLQGGANEILSSSRSALEYPMLFAEVPDLMPADNGAGNVSASRNIGLVVLDIVGDREEAQVWESTEQLAFDVLSRLQHDGRLRQFDFNLNNVKVEPVSTLFLDNERGWRISFPLTTSLNLCYEPAKWTNAGA
jgi:hypothetical protein